MKLANGIRFSVCALAGHRYRLDVEEAPAGLEAQVLRCRRCPWAEVLSYRWPDASDHRRAATWSTAGRG